MTGNVFVDGMTIYTQAGYPLTDDMNGFQQEGVGRMDASIHQGQRCALEKKTNTLSLLQLAYVI